jgi:C-terminal processing protease CtpA/Prc
MYQGTSGILANEGLAGILGSAVLQRYRCVFDYPGKHILFYDNTHDADRLDYDKSGMFLVSDVADRSIVSIIDVIAGSPGAEAGFEVGDIITAVDRIPVKELRLEGIRRLFRRPAGTELQLDIKRDGVYSKSSLILRRII